MTKVRVNGEFFEWDPDNKPMAEMLALEKALDTTYGEWLDGLVKFSARSLAGLIWLLWRRAGRDVPFADIESGAVGINVAEVTFEGGEEEPGPTPAPAARGASSSTGTATSARSAKSG
jgi:hypothetical protein